MSAAGPTAPAPGGAPGLRVVHPAPPAGIDPYRVLFPLGVLLGLWGAGVWPLHIIGAIAYPVTLHPSLMIQGFQLCFITGFLLTAMPAFTHGPRCHPAELAAATLLVLAFATATLTGAAAIAHGAFLATLLLLLGAGVRRIAGNPQKPPEEFVFVGFGMLLGLTGGALLLAGALGAGPELPPRFAERCLSLGFVLALVLGMGSLLVPTFAGIRDPLRIPGIAGPHERRGRRWLYALVLLILAAAVAVEAAGALRISLALRALAAATMGLWVWKLTRRPRGDAPGWALWSSGWMVIAGLAAAALWPAHATAALHVTFLGGFALLTLGVATRVVVSHGRHPLALERRLLGRPALIALAAALLLRLAAEVWPARASHALAGSGLAWCAAWGWWAWGAWGRRSPQTTRRGASQ